MRGGEESFQDEKEHKEILQEKRQEGEAQMASSASEAPKHCLLGQQGK